ncbi:prepilin-type N-terminal cleavage/methylation domain-containing protein [Pseudomonas sp. F1_0610]|uniref:prepilin-type N-terminal cleavage/methylation domain-containing protein n=1 Tax=Pseudomonas sp. F1_0610 TaxID=3114284 RepID=UPI0039C0EBB7
MLKIRYSQAFGLLEVLIVIAIIGILAGIAMPSLNRMVEDAYIKSKANELYSFLFYNRLAVNEGRFGWQTIRRVYSHKWRSHDGHGDKILYSYDKNKLNMVQLNTGFSGMLSFPYPSGNIGFIFCPKDNNPERAYVVTFLEGGLIKRYKKGYKTETEKLNSCDESELVHLYFSMYGDDPEQLKEVMESRREDLEMTKEFDNEEFGNEDD